MQVSVSGIAFVCFEMGFCAVDKELFLFLMVSK